MIRFEDLPDDLIIFEISPLLGLKDHLRLRTISRKISNAFSYSEIWKKKLKERYSMMIQSRIPNSPNYLQNLIQLEKADIEFRKLLFEAKVEEALAMIAEKRGLLLPGLFKLLIRASSPHDALTYDSSQCIRIIMGLEMLKLDTKRKRRRFKLRPTDMLVIELTLDNSADKFKHAINWAVDELIESMKKFNIPHLTKEDKDMLVVRKVLSKYMRVLELMKELKIKWKIHDFLWNRFMYDGAFHSTYVMYISRRFGVKHIMMSNQNCLKVTEPSVGRVYYFKVDYIQTKFQRVSEPDKISLVPEIQIWHFLDYGRRLKELRMLEIVIEEINNKFQNSSQKTGKLTTENTLGSEENKIENGPHILWMIRNRSYFEFGAPEDFYPRMMKWVELEGLKIKNKFRTGDVVRLRGFEDTWVIVGFEITIITEESTSAKEKRTKNYGFKVTPPFIYRKKADINYVLVSLNRGFMRIKSSVLRKAYLMRYGLGNGVVSSCVGAFFSHFDEASGRYAVRNELLPALLSKKEIESLMLKKIL